ncbi:MAG: translation initiation factor IF-6 [Candidatus Diapherotrites archaeon]|nr:translation initiation factor IF-6 [Candidatus Diapherotrites archaeon]
MSSIKNISFHGSPYIGIFCLVTDKFALVPLSMQKKEMQTIEETLNVNAIKTTVCESPLIGVFCAANNNGILLPSTVEEHEIQSIKKETGFEAAKVPTRNTAIGNMIAANDKGAVAHKFLLRDAKDTIEETLDVEAKIATTGEIDIVGSTIIANNKGFLAHPETSPDQMKTIEKILKVKGEMGTANCGDGFVGNSIISNNHGVVVGKLTTGFELVRIDDALLFEEKPKAKKRQNSQKQV